MLKSLQNSVLFIILLCAPCVVNALSIQEQLKGREKAIMDLAKDYESVMIYQYYRSVFESVPIDPISGGGSAERIYRDLLIQEYSKAIAQNAKFGVAESIYKSAIKNDGMINQLKNKINDGKNNGK